MADCVIGDIGRQQIFQRLQQHVRIHRLGEVFAEPGVERALAIRGAGIRRQRERGGRHRGSHAIPQQRDQRVAVLPGHGDVADDGVDEVSVGDDMQRLGHRRGGQWPARRPASASTRAAPTCRGHRRPPARWRRSATPRATAPPAPRRRGAGVAHRQRDRKGGAESRTIARRRPRCRRAFRSAAGRWSGRCRGRRARACSRRRPGGRVRTRRARTAARCRRRCRARAACRTRRLRAIDTITRPLAGVKRTAFESRFQTTCCKPIGIALGRERARELRHDADLARIGGRAAGVDGVLDHGGEIDVADVEHAACRW